MKALLVVVQALLDPVRSLEAGLNCRQGVETSTRENHVDHEETAEAFRKSERPPLTPSLTL
jgi:hypothetical protein